MNVAAVRMESQGFAKVQRQSQEGYIKVKTYVVLQYCNQQVIKRLTLALVAWLASYREKFLFCNIYLGSIAR